MAPHSENPAKKSHNVHYVKLYMPNTVHCVHSAHKKGVQDQIIREKGAGQGISGPAGSGRVALVFTREIKKGLLLPIRLRILYISLYIINQEYYIYYYPVNNTTMEYN